MKRLILLFIAAILPALAFAQTYTVKIYDSHYGMLMENDGKPGLSEIQIPQAVSKDKFAEFLKASPDFVSFDVPQAKPVKFIRAHTMYQGPRKEEKREFLLSPIDGNDSLVNIQIRFTENIQIKTEDGTLVDNSGTVEAAQLISLGVPTIIHRIEQVAKVMDYTPILGNIPLIGRFWRTPGESRMVKFLLVVVTENKEEK